MTNCAAYAINRIVGFYCPLQVKQEFNALDEWFAEFDGKNFLIYRPSPGEYTVLREGEKSKFQKTASRRLVNVRLQDAGFTLQVLHSDARFRYLLMQLAESCLSSDYSRFKPITVIDFVDPGPAAFKQALASNSSPYRLRYGLLEIEAASGFNGQGNQLYGVDGFQVVFRDDRSVLV